VYKVDGEFTSRPGPALSNTLHKSLDYDNPGADVLYCTDCHNPHGDKRSGNDIYPKLLKVADFNGTFYYQRNGFCLACHGLNNKAFKTGNNISTYYDLLGGDHRDGMTAQSGGPIPHYSTTVQAGAMVPVSGTNITCIKCHERHGSKNSSLLDNSLADSEEVQCYKCHGNGLNYAMTGINVYNVITNSVSQHKVGSTAWGKIECSSCHGPHTVGGVTFASSNGTTSSAISNPDNTKQAYTTASGNISGFCLKCHDGAGPSKTANSTTVVPYDISFVNIGFTTNGGGWNKAGPTISYVASKHYTAASNIQCTECHEWHGTAYNWLLIRKEDNATDATGTLICFKCHAGSGAIPNIKADLAQTYKHPTLTQTGVHSNRENYNGGITTRHAECYDCHDVHTVKSTTTTQMDKLGNVSGVKFSQTAWDSWASATASRVDLDPTTNDRQAYLCYKCHSKYAGNQPNPTPGSSGYTPGTFAQTDVAKEFNPSNKARHVVEGTSNMPTFTNSGTTYYYGKFVNGWTATSVMKCTDCHMPASGAAGPHGSATRFILKAAWTPTQSASMASTDLCFLCHDYNFYYSGSNQGSATVRSQFSNGTSNYNLHASKHASGKQKNCSNCHGGLPHGWKYTDSSGGGQALWSSTDARPYKDGSYLGAIPTNATRTPGQWTGQHSGTSCGGTGGCT
jgi:predicted CXXCH cytochrome family protein